MSLRVYLFLVFVVLVISSIANSEKGKYKKGVRYNGLWDAVDNFGHLKVIHTLHFDEDTIFYKKIENFIKKHSNTKATPERMQTMSFMSIGVVLLAQLVIWINYAINVVVFQEQLKKLAELTGNSNLVNIDLPGFRILLWSIVIGYFLPYLYIKVTSDILYKKSEAEMLLLQSFTLMMLKTNKSVKYIINILYERADMYKEPLRKCLESYSVNPKDAISELKNASYNEVFKSMVGALEKALFYDRILAIKYLESSRKLQTEMKKIHQKKKNNVKQVAGALLLIFPLLASVSVVGYPWMLTVLRILTSINEFGG